MINVLVIAERGATGELSPCAYLRLFLPLTKPGVAQALTVHFTGIDDIDTYQTDVVITHRVALPKLRDVDKVFKFCRRTGAKWIFDLDDDLLALDASHSESGHYSQLKPIVLWAASYADQMWVSTPALAHSYHAIASDVVVVPNTLDHRIWRPRVVESTASNSPIRFVYMGTSTHKDDLFTLIAPGFRKLISEFGGQVELDIIGVVNQADPEACWSVVSPPATSAVAYPAFVQWLQSLQRHAVGLAPLCNTPFNRAKSNIKWLEYSGLGLATIAADLPPYQIDTRPGDDILLAEASANGFFDVMRALVLDRRMCTHLRQQAVARAYDQVRKSAAEVEVRVPLIEHLVARNDRSRVPMRVSNYSINKERLDRALLARSFLRGHGIEIGALHNPLQVADDLQVRYVDRLSKWELYEHYPELRNHKLVEVDVIDNGETLEKIEANSQNFVIANHFLEHCQDPIATLKNFGRVLIADGIIYMAIPDKRVTFDQDRAPTPLDHLIEDYQLGSERSRDQHYREWVTLVEPHFDRRYQGEGAIEARVKELKNQGYSIHFHVWSPGDIRELIEYCIEQERLPFDVVFLGEFKDEKEMICVLRKI